MSKVKITGHASGSGTITLTGPNTSSDRTITLPDATGTALMTDGSGASLTALNGTQVTSGTLPTARLPAGSILQVVSDNLTTVVTSSTSWGDITGLSVSITPTASSSTFLVMLEIGSLSHTASSAKDMMVRIMRDSTAIGVGTTGTGGLAATGNHSSEAGMWNAMSGSVIDSPGTASAITYKAQGWANNGTWSINTRGSSTTGNITHSSITVMEIGG